ncbi:hypothetical protein BKA63DRAFT_554505 [Paraphoma chrysanthemicola]|nr:hypothetical protein BKA63DRAFT_554505 [Paraphoma chrysanthemicola]
MTDTSMAHGQIPPKVDAEFSALAHSHFFDLPPELRDMVYHWLWKSTPDIVLSVGRKSHTLRPSGNLTRLTYGVHKGAQSRGLPVWLLTNKSILAEGLRLLRIHRHQTIEETAIKRLSEIGATMNFLAGLPAATHLSVIGDSYKYMDLIDSEKAVSIYAVSENRQNTFEAAWTANLKVLEINLVVAFPYECLRLGQSIDLSFFDATTSSANIRKMALVEATRLGVLLVGSGAVVEVHDGTNNKSLDADHYWSIVVYQA